MRVALNALYVGAGVAGGRVYCEGLLRGLASLDDDTRYTLFLRQGIPFPTFPDRFEIVRVPVSPTSTVWRTLWEYGALPRRVGRGRFDIFHGLGSVSPSAPPGAKFVLTLHDLIYRHFPASLPLGHRLFTRGVQAWNARRADRVIVPSHATRSDAVRLLRLDPRRLRTVAYGSGNPFRPLDDAAVAAVLDKFAVRRPYILSVARGYAHKNLAGLLRAVARLSAHPDARLVLVGESHLVGAELDRLIDELGIRPRVVFTGFTRNEELNALYCGATVFAFPSLCEGLGLPVVEAMACGVPVVASNASAVPEAVGDAGILADAADPDAFAAALARVLADARLRVELRERGFRRATAFTWEKCAADTLAVYKELA